ncbi:MAG: penicillin-binding transpeptidase domain-containing protein, partial [Candidatus Acidiferrales bacterium]
MKFALLAIAAMLAPFLLPAHASKHKSAHATTRKSSHAARRKPVHAVRSTRHRYRHYYRGVPTYMADPAIGDDSRFDDPIVREAALDALGRQNGSVVAVDPSTGRILTIVNQKLAYSAGFEPCSTTKPIIAVAALEKGIVTPDTMIKVGRRRYMDMTEALAHSNNAFFEELGRRLGFDNVWHYDHVFGLGERAGYDIAGEQPGFLPEKAPVYGGVARMCSFGEGIKITPLQLAAVVSTIANGGTMYYLQYPATEAG